MSQADLMDRLRLARSEGVGPVTFRRLLASHGSAGEALRALPELARAAGRAAAPRMPSLRDAEREMQQTKAAGAQLLFLGQPDYPALLALLADAPPVIAVQGDVSALSPRAVALVGARNGSANGQRMANALAADLAGAGLVVVSGMARGIDRAAHEGAMGRGRTIAAVAGGIDCPYPPEHADLQRQIAAKGCVISEAPPGTEPQARHFPRRNRLIAGLSLAVVVVEAALRSGSLITAELAQEAGREIFAVPGSPLDPRCRGSNDLLRQGAHLTESTADVLANMPEHPGAVGLARDPLFARAGRPSPGLAEPPPSPLRPTDAIPDRQTRARVHQALGYSPTPIDELVRATSLNASAVMASLVALELAGVAEILPGNRAVLCP